jgi:hypothetical protein
LLAGGLTPSVTNEVTVSVSVSVSTIVLSRICLVFDPTLLNLCTYEASVIVASGSCSVVVVDCVEVLQVVLAVFRKKDAGSMILHCEIGDLVGSQSRGLSRRSSWNVDVRAAESIRLECIFFSSENLKIGTVEIATSWQCHWS